MLARLILCRRRVACQHLCKVEVEDCTIIQRPPQSDDRDFIIMENSLAWET